MTTPTGKGRPTPKRTNTSRRGGPVTPPPKTRKEAAKRTRDQAALSRARVKQGTAQGDERYLAPRDAGPVRALVRDTVDGRRNVGVLLLPLALVLLLAQLSNNQRIQGFALTLWLTGVLAVVADAVVTTVLLRKRLQANFPDEPKLRGHLTYGLLRSTVLRRFRLPATRVAPGGPRTP